MGASTCRRPRLSAINKSATSEDTTKHYFPVSAPGVAAVRTHLTPISLDDSWACTSGGDEMANDLRSTFRVMQRWRDCHLPRFHAFNDMRANFHDGMWSSCVVTRRSRSNRSTVLLVVHLCYHLIVQSSFASSLIRTILQQNRRIGYK